MKPIWTSTAILLALVLLALPNTDLLASAQETHFSLIWITDTQYLAENNPSYNDALSRWIITNNQTYNIKMVIHTGDLVNDEGNKTQWQNANQSMGILLDNGIPYTWCAGNHDYNGSIYIGNQYAAFNPHIMANKSYWLSSVDTGMSNAVFFNVSGREYLIISIAYNANDTTLTWANNILDAYPQAYAIVVTHAYLDKQGRYTGWGENLKDTVLDKHANVFLTLSGHYYPTQGYRAKSGDRHELLFNQQDAYDKLGAASARVLTFDVGGDLIKVQTYSVLSGRFLEGPENSFVLDSCFGGGFGLGLRVFLIFCGVAIIFSGGLYFVWKRVFV